MTSRKRAETQAETRRHFCKALKSNNIGNRRKHGDTMTKLLKTWRRRKRKHIPPLKGGLRAAPFSGLVAVPA